MAFQLGDDDHEGMSEMNLIPLIDIMLVLMIIFLVTATVLNPAVPLSLPQADAQAMPEQPKVVSISIDANGQMFWDQSPVSLAELEQNMQTAAQEQPKPSIHLRTDKDARYDHVAQVLARASQAGLNDLAFVSEAVR
ncbi:MAG: biopolymer transporter ExbD [Pseudomonadota bacterium]|nr:biopolymer transporter ExbD [Pseudomonadota bacterium]